MNKSLVILIWSLIVVIIISKLLQRKTLIKQLEHFSNKKSVEKVQSDNIYDKFYCNIYDDLFGDRGKVMFEVKQIRKHALDKWKPKSSIKILDAGCGTGWHLKLLSKDYDIIGVDRSPHMLNRAKRINNSDILKLGNINDSTLFRQNTFSHVLCLYFTIYYMEDMIRTFRNFYKWLKPNGVLILHVVDREKFDPLLNHASPFPFFSLQKYSKKRLTESKVHFNNFIYKANFKLDAKKNECNFTETFNYKKKPQIRKQVHKLNMPSRDSIVTMARNNGFKLFHKIGLIPVSFEYQYIYLFRKI